MDKKDAQNGVEVLKIQRNEKQPKKRRKFETKYVTVWFKH